MIPTTFEYVAPTSVDEALAALAEGGDDAKLLVHEQFAIYQKLAAREHL